MANRLSIEQLTRAIERLEQSSDALGIILDRQLDENSEKWAKENGWFFNYYEGFTGFSRKEENLPSEKDFEIAKETMNLEDVLDGIFEHLFDEEDEEVTLEDIRVAAENMKKIKKLGSTCVVVNGTASQEIVSWLKESGFVMRTFESAFAFAENEDDLPTEEELEMRYNCGDAFCSFLSAIVELS